MVSLCHYLSFAQVTLTGSGTILSTPVNAPAIVVDPALTLTSSLTFTSARVSISTNFNSGDQLVRTGTLPSGVTSSYNASTGVLTITGSGTAAQYQELLRSVTFSTSSTVVTQRTITFEMGDGTIRYNSSNDHYYMVVSGSYNWNNAKTEAESIGRKFFGLQGYLATITTTSESNFVNALSAKGWLGGSDDYTFINGATGTSTFASQAASEGKWYWVTGPEKGTQFSNGGTLLTFANWQTGEPNNANSTEHYVENAWANGKWNDATNTTANNFIIEYGGTGGDPVVDIYHTRDIKLIATSVQVSNTNQAYSLKAPPTTVDNSFILYSSGNITNVTVTISNGFRTGDALSYAGSLPGGVTASYNSSTGVLSFTGTASASQWQALLRTVTFYSTSTIIGNRMVTFSVGNLISGSNGHFYEFVTPAVNWSTAKTNASARSYMGLQGYLATITSQTENDFIQQKLSADGWIGASDAVAEINSATGTSTFANQTAAEGKWYWVTGPEKGTQFSNGNSPSVTQLTYMNWNSGEPNNSSGNENYAQIYSSSSTGRWNDLSGAGNLGYVVEYGGLSTDPLLELSGNKTIVITNVLPVTGLQFGAGRSNNSVQLKWTTVSEQNTLRFDVLHSTDGTVFSKIGEVAAAQNSTVARSYTFMHASPVPGINYYKLQIRDIDGFSRFSEVRQVSFAKTTFSIAPNPATKTLIVNSPFGGKAVVMIKNISGSTVLKQTVSQQQARIDISSLSAGVYFAEITDDRGQIQSVKFIKE